MIKPKRKITNPMTIIAIFAALSEASAAVSLPFLDNKEREIYIWFLISFPFYLLFLFFATLNFNYRSLYAPSDFEKGKHFIKVMGNADQPQNSPFEDSPEHWVNHYLRLPMRAQDLHIIDARVMCRKTEFNNLMEKVQQQQEKPEQLIVFITNADSEAFLKESALKHSKQSRKRHGTTLCVVYNLSSRDVTTVG
ncbi:hypothetical protein [Pseudomonas arsenicoxydans]|uniref:Uncharacterized protein n=1 Tax=Pseudomonas arsenicoxydans TaxID=702115 RepID=A0A4V0YKP5_9PSED|nr:hypothetical protein [Pseudomonas arsenicoxydans]QAY87864.1 hypothetical protein CUN61_29670 [Pseudomonas arsenicoxydans]